MEPQNRQSAALTSGLAGDIRTLINDARSGLAATVNSALTMLYWRIGRRIRTDVMQGERAGYGEQIVASLSRQSEADHGRGFGAKNLRHMLRFGEVFETEEIVYALSRQLSWTHSRQPTKVKWNCTCAGWRKMNKNRAKLRRWESYFAPAKIVNR